MLIREMLDNTVVDLEEGPILDKMKKAAVAGAVAGGLGYAALSGTPANAASIPKASPQATATQQASKPQDAQQAAKIERIRKAVDSLQITQAEPGTIQKKIGPTTVDDQYLRGLQPQQLDAEVKRWEDLAARQNAGGPAVGGSNKLAPSQQAAAAAKAAQFEAQSPSDAMRSLMSRMGL